MGGQRLGGVRLEPPRHVLEINLAIGAAHGLLMLRCAFEQFIIHQRVGQLTIPIAQQRPVPSRMQNDMGGFHVNDPVTLLLQFVYGQRGDAGEKFRSFPSLQAETFRCLNRVRSLDPTKKHDVLPEDVNFHAGMADDFRPDFVFGPARLPELQPFGRHVNRQRLLRPDMNARRTEVALAQFHEQ